jgi:hypothetical protein
MATESEVSGSCVGEIDVSVRMENRGVWLCCGLIYLGFIWGVKSGSSVAAMGLDGARYRKPFGTFCGLVEEIKSPCDNRGLAGLGC